MTTTVAILIGFAFAEMIAVATVLVCLEFAQSPRERERLRTAGLWLSYLGIGSCLLCATASFVGA